jgi:tetratricopeptide (TPR) repeat protein
VSNLDPWQDSTTDERLRREGAAWRGERHSCPPPDLVIMHSSEALPEEVRARLEQHLETCDACRRLARNFDAAERASEGDVERRVFERVKRGPRWTPSRRLMLAAGFLLAGGLAALWWVRSGATTSNHVAGGPPSLSSPAASPAPVTTAPSNQVALWVITPATVRIPLSSLEATRGSDGKAAERSRALLAALEPYQSGDYGAATSRLEAFVQQYPAAADGFLYLGVSYLMAGRPAEALAPLERAAALKPEAERREIDWYLAAADQRSGRLPNAKTLLGGLCEAPGAFQPDACAAEATLR